jgi:predicted secreted protein
MRFFVMLTAFILAAGTAVAAEQMPEIPGTTITATNMTEGTASNCDESAKSVVVVRRFGLFPRVAAVRACRVSDRLNRRAARAAGRVAAISDCGCGCACSCACN